MRGRSYRPSYTIPEVDSQRAIAAATMFLTNARSLSNTTAELLARQYQLSPKRAEYMISIETQRRAKQA